MSVFLAESLCLARPHCMPLTYKYTNKTFAYPPKSERLVKVWFTLLNIHFF